MRRQDPQRSEEGMRAARDDHDVNGRAVERVEHLDGTAVERRVLDLRREWNQRSVEIQQQREMLIVC
jgi:hypothetical protein